MSPDEKLVCFFYLVFVGMKSACMCLWLAHEAGLLPVGAVTNENCLLI